MKDNEEQGSNLNKYSLNTFEKGLFQDGQKNPDGTYRYCLNGVIVDPYIGENYALSNERGFKQYIFKYNFNTDPDYYVVGHSILGTDIILFSAKLDGDTTVVSEIGIFSTSTHTYKTILNDSDVSMVKKGKLNFSINYRIDAESRISFDDQRYVYFTDGFNKPRRVNLDRTAVYSDLDLETALIPEFSIPIVEPLEVQPGGQLYASSYSFCARYLTDNLDPTTTGLVSHPIPVGPIRTGTTDLGANWDEPLINKRIKLNISNVDTNYKYIELIVIYWKGASNQKILQVFDRININNQTTIEAYYDGNVNEYLKNITEGEVVQELVNYSTAKHIIQKDGRLFLSNLTALPEDDFQKIASQLEVGYYTEEYEYTGLNDPDTVYKNNEMDTFSRKCYQRGEVYSLAIAFVLKSGRITFAYHIPGNYKAQGSTQGDYAVTPDTLDPWRKGLCGTFVSDERYTYDIYAGTQSYTGENEHVRHHLMPSLLECPHIVRYDDGANGAVPGDYNYSSNSALRDSDYVRYLYLTINNLYDVLSMYPELRDQITGYIILREERSSFGNSRIISQGITNKFIYNYGKAFQTTNPPPAAFSSPWDKNWYYYHSDAQLVRTAGSIASPPGESSEDPTYIIDPFFGNTTIRNYNNNDAVGGIYYPSKNSTACYNRGIVVDPYTYDSTDFYKNASDEACGPSHIQGYLSPETVFSQLNVPVGFQAQQVYTFKGNVSEVVSSIKYNGLPSKTGDREFVLYLMCDYDVSKIKPNITSTYTKRTILDSKKVKNQPSVTPETNGIFKVSTFYRSHPGTSYISTGKTKVINPGSEGYTFLELDNVYPTPSGNDVSWTWDIAIHFHAKMDRAVSLITWPVDPILWTDPFSAYNNQPSTYYYDKAYESRRNITNIINSNNTTQYGTVDISKYIPVLFENIDNLSPSSSVFIRNGDIFISKFAFRVSTKFKFRIAQAAEGIGNVFDYPLYSPHNLLFTEFNGPDLGFDDSLDTDGGNRQESARLRALSYVWLESKINGFWRHRPIERPIPYDNTNSTTGTPFYPDSSAYDHLETSTGFSDAQSSGYNITYSYDVGAKYYFTRPFGFKSVTKYPTRTIYSDQSIVGEQSDHYRIFLQNNYQDLPKNKGEITNQFVLNGKLYLHTEDSLWETFVNTSVQINTQDKTSVYLGNAGVFSRPAIEVLTVDGGYAGCIHKWGCAASPFGYIFPDGKNKELFMFTDRLVSITDNGMSSWFFNNYEFTEVGTTPNFYDNAINPNGVGLVSGFNTFSKKYMIHIKRLNTQSNTLSFNVPTTSWISFHSYNPSILIDIGAYTYSVSNIHRGSIYLHEYGDTFGKYYDSTINPFVIEFQSNGDFQFTKVFDNLSAYAYFKDSNNNYDLSDFFKSVTYTDSVQSTSTVELKLKSVSDNGLTKANYFNHNVALHNQEYRLAISKVSTNYKDIVTSLNPRFKDRYLNCRFTYDNAKNNKTVVQYFTTKYRINAR